MQHAEPLPSYLAERYHSWRDGDFKKNSTLFHKLATEGQQPKSMIVACCDSRVQVSAIFGANPGDYFVYASGDPDKLDDIWDVMSKEIRGLKDSITQDELVSLRSKMATAAVIAAERPGGRMQRLGRLWTMTGEYQPLEDEMAKIEAISIDSLKALCDQYPIDKCTLGKMIPAASE